LPLQTSYPTGYGLGGQGLIPGMQGFVSTAVSGPALGITHIPIF